MTPQNTTPDASSAPHEDQRSGGVAEQIARIIAAGASDGMYDAQEAAERSWPDWLPQAEAILALPPISAAPDMAEALRALLVFAEDAETKALVGDEGCLWPVEFARAALLKATGHDQ